MKIALYARISTTDPNCEMQLRELREYCQCRGWSIYQEYVDIRWSGSKAIRPQRSKLMADAVVHRFDAVLVWTLQRWGRSLADCAESLQQLHNWGIRWMAVAQKLEMDKATSTSHLIVHVLRSMAELERELMRERVKDGIKAAKHRGQQGGRPMKMFDRSLVGVLQAQGLSVRAIATRLGVSVGTAHAVLQSCKTS
jgi:DNA invertase Pin-like site-specific DNA recombinase